MTLVVSKHIDYGRLQLRPADEAECRAGGFDPQMAVMQSAMASDEYFAVYLKDRLVAVWGYSAGHLFSNRCQAWMLSTPEAEWHRIRFARSSLRIMHHLFETFEEVEVCTHEKHIVALEWLAWLGFTIQGTLNGFHTLVAKRSGWKWAS